MSTTYWVMLIVTIIVAVAINGALIAALVRFKSQRGQDACQGHGRPRRDCPDRRPASASSRSSSSSSASSCPTAHARSTKAAPRASRRLTRSTAQVPIRGVSNAALEAADTATLSEEPEGGVFKPAAGDPLVIDAIAQQWLWRFEYPGGTPGQRTFSYGELVVPVDTAVVLEIDSTDVIHSWWVPALTGQVQAIPGDISQTWFKADEVGTYYGRGTVFDGTSYPSLTAQVRVVEAAEYETYVEGLTSDLAEAQDAVVQAAAAESASEEATETGDAMTPPPTAVEARPEVVTRTGTAQQKVGWVERATSGDHKGVARLYLGGALSFLVVALVQWALMRVQLIVPDSTLIVPETFARLLSASGITFLMLFCVPMVLAIAGFVVPLQIGARGVAFPRLNLLSAWLYIAGGVVLYAGFAYTPGEGGVLGLAPLSDTVFNPGRGMDNWIMGLGLAIIGFVLFAVNMIVTVRRMRAPGMAWRRLPLFSWAATVISVPDRGRRPGDDRRARDAHDRPPLRRRLLRRRARAARRCSTSTSSTSS